MYRFPVARFAVPSSTVLLQCARRIGSLALLLLGAATNQAQTVQNFPSTTAVGSTATLPVTVAIATAGTATAPIAVTGGVANLDFSLAAGGTCAAGTAYTVGQQCTVVAQFAPKYPGRRVGAILLKDSSGNLLGSATIGGKASGALPVLVPGRIDTVAGSGLYIPDSQQPVDGITATSARIFEPQAVAVDFAGNLLFSDTNNNRVRRVDAHTGLISTLAGNGGVGFSGDGAAATQATLNSPMGLALDGAGNVYFADTQNHVVRCIDAITGKLRTVAGTPQTYGSDGDHGAATSAHLNRPQGVAFDVVGHLLIADSGNNEVRQVDLASGIITTLAGNGSAGFSGDGSLATAARLNFPTAVLMSNDGSLLIADFGNNRIRRVSLAGTMSTIAGTGDTAIAGDGGPASAANLAGPASLAMDPVGNLYIADKGNDRIRVVDAQTAVISTLASNGRGFTGDGGPANLALMYGPSGLAFTQSGDLYLADAFNMRVRRISGSTNKLTYSTIREGKVSPAQLQLLANYGDTALHLATPVLDAAQLDSAMTTCTTITSLAPSATCKLGIEFAPTITGDDVIGHVTLPSDAANVTPVITLDGQVLDVNPTSIAVVSSANPSVVGAQVVFTATVTSDDTGRTGNVTFTADGTTICSGMLGTNGTAVCSTSSLALGSHSIVAKYAGDDQNAAATSATLAQVVKQQATLTIGSSINPSVYSNAVIFTVTAKATTGTPGGTVTFLDGTATLGSTTLSQGQAALTLSTLAVGAHSITVQYAGDTQNAPSTSAAFSQTVQQVTTTTMLATSAATTTVGLPVTLTATVASTNGPTPTGTVTFAEGGMTYGTVAISTSGIATMTLSTLTPGTHNLTAAYSGDTNSSTSTSAPLVETIQQIQTTTTLTANANPLSAGATLHLSAQVAMAGSAPADGAIDGQVVFADGATTLATVQLNGALTASLDLHALTVGSHTLTATYQGNTNYSGSNGIFTETVTATSTTTALTATMTPTLAGTTASFNAVVTSATGTPTGTVTLNDGSVIIAAGKLGASGTVSFSTTSLTAGAHTLTATYGGDPNYLTSTSAPVVQTVNLATVTVTLSGPAGPVDVTTAATFRGTVSSPGIKPTGTLTLLDGTMTIATQPVNSSFTFSSNSFTVGAHTLTVSYSGDGNNGTAQSAAVALTVRLAPTGTAIATSGSPSVVGTSVTFTTATTSATNNLTGSVSFFDGSTLLGTVTMTNGTAALSTSALAAGAHSITATYTGDTNHAASTSPALSQNVVQQPVVNLVSGLNPANSGQTVLFTASLPSMNGTVPTGNVVFASDGTPLATAALDASGTVRMQTAALAVGSHAITATYAGDTNFAGAVGSLTQIVKNATTSAVLVVSADPVTYGTPEVLTATVTSNGGTATGAVSFTENGIAIGSANLTAAGVATLSLNTLAPARHTIIANYLGDGKASPSSTAAVSFLVRQRTTLALGSSANPALSLAGITVTATLANDGAAPATGSIVFTEGATILGTVALDGSGQAALGLQPLSVGTHTISATYAGDDGDFPAQAAALQQVVQLRGTTTALTTSATSATDAQQVTLIAIVQSPTLAAGTMPTGSVTFTSGSNILGVMQLDASSVATLTIRLPASTSETVIATYNGDVAYSGSTSAKQTATSGAASQFVLSVSNPTIQLQSGSHTVVNLTVASVKGFNDTLKFGCLGLPFAATCTFSQADMKLAANGTGTLQLTIDTGNPLGAGTGTSAANVAPFAASHAIAICLLPAALLLCCFRKSRRLPTLVALLLACAATLGVTGCAGLTTNTTPAGTYTFQVTALGQGSGANEAQTITLTVAK